MSQTPGSATQITDRIRRAWGADGSAPDLRAALTPDVLASDDDLLAAVVADADERSARGMPVNIDEYALVIPELATRNEVCRAILMHEFGRTPSRDRAALGADLKRRYPALADDIDLVAELCDMMDDSLGGAILPPRSLQSGERLAKYDLVEHLGEGSFGEVWQAWDRDLERFVALKFLHAGPAEGRGAPGPSDTLSRVMSEARAAAGLDHENIVAVHDAGVLPETGRHYIDSQLVCDPDPTPEDPRRVRIGASLDRLAMSHGVPSFAPREAARIMARVCRGVAGAHARAVLHRDIKPGNILLTPSGRPLVADFGLSMSGAGVHDTGTPDPSKTVFLESERGRIIGTPAYMSPEQAEGMRATPLSDVYALGATLRFLLTGAPPFAPTKRYSDDARWDVIEQVRRVEPPALASAARTVPGTLGAICDKAMAKRAEDRYISADQMAEDLSAWLARRPTLARHASPPVRLALFLRRNAVVAAIAIAATLGLGVGAVRYVADIARERDRAVEAERLAEKHLQEARTAEATSKAVNEFIQGILGAADPRVGGKDMKVVAALGLASEKIEKELKDQPAVEAGVRTMIAHTYRTLDDFENASPQLEKALEIRRRLSGDDDPGTLVTLHEIALMRAEQRKFDESEAMLGKVLDARRRVLPPDHEETLTALNDLAVIKRMSGKLDESERLFHESIAARTRAFGPDHTRTLAAVRSLAGVYFLQDMPEKGEPLLRQVVDAMHLVAGSSSHETLMAINDLAVVLRSRAKYQEAEPLFREAYSGYSVQLPPGHGDTLSVGFNLVGDLRDQKRAEEGLPIAQSLLAAAQLTGAAGQRFVATAQQSLAMCLIDLKRFAEAEAPLLAAADTLTRIVGEKHARTQGVYQLLAGVYSELGQPDRAAEFRAKIATPAAPTPAPNP